MTFKGARYPPTGPHESLLYYCARLVRIDGTVARGPDGAKYALEAQAVRRFARRWARLLLGWEGAEARYE